MAGTTGLVARCYSAAKLPCPHAALHSKNPGAAHGLMSRRMESAIYEPFDRGLCIFGAGADGVIGG